MPKKKSEKITKNLAAQKILDALLERAVFEGASAVHFEPNDTELAIRYRQNGALKKITSLPKTSAASLLARIKILANLNPKEKHRLAEGSFEMNFSGQKISCHASVLPILHGEKIVIHLLSPKTHLLPIEKLGFSEGVLEIVKKNLQKPHGLILVAGAKNSPQIPVLFSFLNFRRESGVQVSTVEESKKIVLPEFHQNFLNPKIGYFFKAAFSAAKNSATTILVDNLKNKETMEEVAVAALAGRQILAGFHAENCAVVLERLQRSNLQPFLIASTNLIIAVKKIKNVCPACAGKTKLSAQQEKDLEKHLNIKELKKILVNQKILKSASAPLSSLSFRRAKGCKKCGGDGYLGQTDIFEVLKIDAELAQMILEKTPVTKIIQKAKTKGILSLFDNTFLAAAKKLTDLEEVMKIIK
jgi:type II secretory ATPase GspE/PulE/Tfp pilus assembly ATPase PilB-like protein